MLSIKRSSVFAHIQRHAVAYVLATTLGTLSIAPYVYFASTAPEYASIAMMGQDAEEHYLARMQEAYEGHIFLGNVFTSNKDIPYLSPGLGEMVIAGISKITGLHVSIVNMTTKFFLPTLIFLLLYGFGVEVSRSRLAALTGATIGMLGIDIMSNPRSLLSLVHGYSLMDGIYWARPINPQMSGILLFGGLWQLYRAYTHQNRASWTLIGTIGVLIGLSLYISVFVWSFLGLLLLLFCIYGFVQGNRDFALKILSAGVVAGGFAIPFGINYLAATALPGYETASQFQGALTSHLPPLGLWIGVLIALPFLAWRDPLGRSRTFFMLSSFSLLIALNQQIITGFYLQPGHYHWYITKPLTGFLIGIMGTLLLIHYAGRQITILLCTIGILTLFVHGALSQRNFYVKNLPAAEQAQVYAPLFEYLNHSPEATIYANHTLSDYLAIYTHDDPPGSWYTGLYFLPKDYLKNRLFFEYRLSRIGAKNSLAVLTDERDAIAMQLYGGNWSNLPNNTEALPDTILETLSEEYTTSANQPLENLAHTLGISYLLQDIAHDQWIVPKNFIRESVINNRFVLYRVP